MTARTQEHAPGPWRAHDNGLGEFSVLACHDTMRVASCSFGQISDPANARLIAAAPDLLAACEALQTATVLLNNHALAGTDYDSTVILSALAMAHAAIARARGSK
jgi:hypothetical protein